MKPTQPNTQHSNNRDALVSTIALTAVVSSQLAAFGYDGETNTLAIRFNPKAGEEQGPLYHYFGVPQGVFNAMSDSDSKGTFFYAHIKHKYDWQKIEPELEDVKHATQEPTYHAAVGGAAQDSTAGTTQQAPGEQAA